MIDLTQVLTFSEAAEKWGFANGNTLRKAVERKKFMPDEIRKSGDIWLTTYEAMARVFGQPRASHRTVSMDYIENLVTSSLYSMENKDEEFRRLLDTIQEAVVRQETITVIRDEDHADQIISVIKTKEDLENFSKVMECYLSSFL